MQACDFFCSTEREHPFEIYLVKTTKQLQPGICLLPSSSVWPLPLVMLLAWDAAVGSYHLLEDEHQDSFENGEISYIIASRILQ